VAAVVARDPLHEHGHLRPGGRERAPRDQLAVDRRPHEGSPLVEHHHREPAAVVLRARVLRVDHARVAGPRVVQIGRRDEAELQPVRLERLVHRGGLHGFVERVVRGRRLERVPPPRVDLDHRLVGLVIARPVGRTNGAGGWMMRELQRRAEVGAERRGVRPDIVAAVEELRRACEIGEREVGERGVVVLEDVDVLVTDVGAGGTVPLQLELRRRDRHERVGRGVDHQREEVIELHLVGNRVIGERDEVEIVRERRVEHIREVAASVGIETVVEVQRSAVGRDAGVGVDVAEVEGAARERLRAARFGQESAKSDDEHVASEHAPTIPRVWSRTSAISNNLLTARRQSLRLTSGDVRPVRRSSRPRRCSGCRARRG